MKSTLLTGGNCEGCLKVIKRVPKSENNIHLYELQTWSPKKYRFCSYKCYYSRCAEGNCKKCECKITNLENIPTRYGDIMTGKYWFCSHECQVKSMCKVSKYDQSADPCSKCEVCKRCWNCEKCECPKEEAIVPKKATATGDGKTLICICGKIYNYWGQRCYDNSYLECDDCHESQQAIYDKLIEEWQENYNKL